MFGKSPTNQLNDFFSKIGKKLPEAHISKRYDQDLFVCRMEIAGRILSGYGFSKQMAKHDCAYKALELLRKIKNPMNNCEGMRAQKGLILFARTSNLRYPEYEFENHDVWEVTCKFLNFETIGRHVSKIEAKNIAAILMARKIQSKWGFKILDETNDIEFKKAPKENGEYIKERRIIKEHIKKDPSHSPRDYFPFIENAFSPKKTMPEKNKENYISFKDFMSVFPRMNQSRPILDEPNEPMIEDKNILLPTPASPNVPLDILFAKFKEPVPVPELKYPQTQNPFDCSSTETDIQSMEAIFRKMKIDLQWNVEAKFVLPNGDVKIISDHGPKFQEICSNLFEMMVRRNWTSK